MEPTLKHPFALLRLSFTDSVVNFAGRVLGELLFHGLVAVRGELFLCAASEA